MESNTGNEGNVVRSVQVIVVGAGAAGVGVAVALSDAGVTDLLVVDRYTVGASFALWPAETRFITPSFPTNSVGMLDLNSIAIGVSPAYSLEVEHPTGLEYGEHLRGVAEHFEVPVWEGVSVETVVRTPDGFHLHTDQGTIHAKYVVWAVGEFQYPRDSGFEGASLCRHTATVEHYAALEGDDFVIIGGYESGVDAAYHLAQRGKRVQLLDSDCPWESEDSDPSVALATFTLERMREPSFDSHVELFADTTVTKVEAIDGGFQITTADGHTLHSPVPPLLASGFVGGHALVADLFEKRKDGYPLLNQHDESTTTPGLYLSGPAVRHGNNIFCFIFKYRQRFAVVAKSIATALGLPAEGLETYRAWGMFLDDLTVCGEDCVC
ncbi:MAG: monooxygenase [Deltaproteobacteria bacterium]|nr:monooxygenase [Deltaproteobacteria bacterium]HCH65050.1 monooxygenase [Deltaproteobacteria bacterium]